MWAVPLELGHNGAPQSSPSASPSLFAYAAERKECKWFFRLYLSYVVVHSVLIRCIIHTSFSFCRESTFSLTRLYSNSILSAFFDSSDSLFWSSTTCTSSERFNFGYQHYTRICEWDTVTKWFVFTWLQVGYLSLVSLQLALGSISLP